MSMDAHIIVHGFGGSEFLNRARGIGAAELIKSTRDKAFDSIIFSGGKTYGSNKPSEAEGMRDAFSEVLTSPNVKIHLEESSCDTRMNATESLKFLGEGVHDSVIFLLSTGWHLPRINGIYQELGVRNRVLLDTNLLVDEELRGAILSHPQYRMGAMKEPIARLFEHPALRKIKRMITSQRIND